MYTGDILIHIDETLDDDRIHHLERDLAEEEGVYGAYMHERARHLLLVDYDVERLTPGRVLQSVRDRGLHAEMVGL